MASVSEGKTSSSRWLWDNIRRLGRNVEDGLYDFSEKDGEKEDSPSRNAIVALLNTFMTVWKANQVSAAERIFGLLAFGSVAWLFIGGRGPGALRQALHFVSLTFVAIWFLPGLFAATWTVGRNMGWDRFRNWRTFALMLSFGSGGLITLRVVFGDLIRPRHVLVKTRERVSGR